MYDPTKPYKHRILKLIRRTWNTPYVKIEQGLYPIIKKKFSLSEVQHTDGIGTKGIYHWKQRAFRSAATDALAMNLNDLAMVGATPYALQNHIVIPKDDPAAILEIINALVAECRKRNIAVTGGETSIHSDAKGMDISITISGFLPVARKNQLKIGDVLIGLKSNGLHSNGITKIREIFGNKYRKEFTAPTLIYLDTISSLLKKAQVNGMMHITGGAFTKLKDILANADAVITHPKRLRPHNIFQEMHRRGLSSRTMYSTFNCGIGFVLSVPRRETQKALVYLKDAEVIGKVTAGSGCVRIRSAFDQKTIKF